ncbi:hypothetical protein [Orrella daihaiensis]|uniref:Uncharacterized protein n=1 Tax=Orrella daihaiensis TaxID=2782176 RepID=A0ABY4AK91_9BURK|nr:hypothetical protein [Orrella daihaiensis]UOD50701.1 hypothetical protein DHf2319_01845 [Orrella daihaiensis]
MNIKYKDTKPVRVEFQRIVTESVNLLVPDLLDESEVKDLVRDALENKLVSEIDCTPEYDEIPHYSVSVEIEQNTTPPQHLFRKIVYIDPNDELIVRDIRFDENGIEVCRQL